MQATSGETRRENADTCLSAVVLAKARTHNPRGRCCYDDCPPANATDRFRDMGPGVRQDDEKGDEKGGEKGGEKGNEKCVASAYLTAAPTLWPTAARRCGRAKR
jgi:hypothetical protein